MRRGKCSEYRYSRATNLLMNGVKHLRCCCAFWSTPNATLHTRRDITTQRWIRSSQERADCHDRCDSTLRILGDISQFLRSCLMVDFNVNVLSNRSPKTFSSFFTEIGMLFQVKCGYWFTPRIGKKKKHTSFFGELKAFFFEPLSKPFYRNRTQRV